MKPEQPAGQALRFNPESVVPEPHQVQNTPREYHEQVQRVSRDFGVREDDAVAEPGHFDCVYGVPEVVLGQRRSDCDFDEQKARYGEKRNDVEEVRYSSRQKAPSYEGKEDEKTP